MPHIEIKSLPPSGGIMSHCPECSAGLVVMSIIPGRVGRGGCEYWTMRCTRCGGIHLDIVEPVSGAPAE
jgi:uncharacterized Zn finger protein